MEGFSKLEVKTEAELKQNWIMYSCGGTWIGINKTTGKKAKRGTYFALLTQLSIEEERYGA